MSGARLGVAPSRWVGARLARLCAAFVLLGCGAATPQPAEPGRETGRLVAGCLERDEPTCMAAGRALESEPRDRARQATMAAVFYRACLRGDPEGCGRAAALYERDEVAPPHRRRAGAMFEHVCQNRFPIDPGGCAAGALHGRACEGGRGASCAALADLHLSGRLGRRRPALAASLWSRACATGHAASCQRVAEDGVRADPAGAAMTFAKGCDAGVGEPCARLADLLERGFGVTRDLPRARRLRKRACELEHGGGCRALAGMWLRGLGGSTGRENAFALLERACALGDADACLGLADAHEAGSFGEADMARYYELSGKAAKLYAPSCEAGDAHACHVLGALHRKGGGVREDESLGLTLQQTACEAGYGPACIAWLSRGPHRISIKSHPDMARAVSDACRRGDGDACYAVGWIGRRDLTQAGARPPMHPFARGCRSGHAPSCNAAGIEAFPPTQAGMAQLESACELGYAPGCHHLGVAKEVQSAVESTEAAVAHYSRACGLGWMAACTRLGMLRREGHVTPGAMSARSAFEKACGGGDASGCFQLGSLMRAESGRDVEHGVRLLERACKAGHVGGCTELGIARLTTGAEQRGQALAELGRACDAGGQRACIVLVGELADGDDKRRALLDKAIGGATGACNEGLEVCGGDQPSTAVSRRWGDFEGLPVRELEHAPACGVALERACVVVRDAHVLRCELTATECFESGAEIRRLAAAGLSVGVADAVEVEAAGFAHASSACRKRDARACASVARAYRDGVGVAADDKRAERFQQRACQLDASICAP